MDSRIEVYAKSSSSGKPLISGIEKFNAIFEKFPNKAFFIEISCIEPGNAIHHCWYIMKMIVPAFIRGNLDKGIIITPQEAIEEIKEACPAFYRKDGKFDTFFDWKSYQPMTEMEPLHLEFAIEWLHMYCLTNFNIVVGNYKSI